MRILVTGGSGYIGSHVARALVAAGHSVSLLDRHGREAVAREIAKASTATPSMGAVTRHLLDLRGARAAVELDRILRDDGIDAVVHLAGSKNRIAAASQPLRHIDDHVRSTSAVLAGMASAGVRRLVLSSTAAVYGAADGALSESSPIVPTGPYGHAALAAEWLVQAQSRVTDLASIVLRQFLVLGAENSVLVDLGAETIVSMIHAELILGRAPHLHGTDYPTADGTCIRDVVHVNDVAQAHRRAIESLLVASPGCRVYNVGTGIGSSVRQIVEGVRHRFPGAAPALEQPRRVGDAAIVVADISRIVHDLDWRPRHSLDDMLDSALGPVRT